MKLWRPVGMNEMRLVFASGMRAFPPRLAGQPIFYPVLNAEYAAQIAREWNTKEEPFAGYVLRFEVPDDYAAQFEVRTVGNAMHQELWVPAAALVEFNSRIAGAIVGEQAFFGPRFRGDVPERFNWRGKDAYAQIVAQMWLMDHALMEFALEIPANAATFYLNFPFWKAAGAARLGVDPAELERCLGRMREIWSSSPKPAPVIEDASVVP
jgi:hypothetical protein